MQQTADARAPNRGTLLVRAAHLLDGSLVDLLARDGVIESITPHDLDVAPDRPRHDQPGPTPHLVVEAGGGLLIPALAEPHAHIDKAYSAFAGDHTPLSLEDAVARFERVSGDRTLALETRVAAARRAFDRLILAGVGYVRSHVDIGVETSFDHLEAVIRAHREVASAIDLETVALAYNPIVGPEGAGNRRALASALEAGAARVGGAPQFADDPTAALSVLLDAAEEAGVGVDVHLDETLDPRVFLLPELCRQVEDRSLGSPVAASHCVSLGQQPEDVQVAVADRVARAGIEIIVLPQTNLLLQGQGMTVRQPRGLAPIQLLVDHGVDVRAGGDNVGDAFNPLGSFDPIETAQMCVYAGHRSPADALGMVTSVSSAAGCGSAALRRGARCDVVVFDEPTPEAVLSRRALGRTVIRGGRVIASTVVDETRHG